MKIFSALVVLLLFCVACSDVKPDMSKPAVVGFPTPMFDGMIGAVQGQVMKTLSPQTLVYVQNATLTVGDQEYVKIFWNDTTGYVPRSWLLEDGRLGVVDCTEANPIEIFDDEQLKSPSGKTMSEMQLIAYKEMPNGLSKIVYMYEKDGARPWFGYFRHPVTSDSASMAFFNLYYEAFRLKRYENNPEPYEALKRDDRFNNIALRASVFGLPTSGAASAGHTEMKWVDANGNELTGDNIPGQFILHYIWDDDTESDGNHLGDDLEQGTPQCDPQHSAKAYKMLFIPNKTMDFTLICNMPSIAITDGGPMKLDFVNGEAGTTYEFLITHRVYGVVCDDETTFIVETEFGRGEGMVHASCGD